MRDPATWATSALDRMLPPPTARVPAGSDKCAYNVAMNSISLCENVGIALRCVMMRCVMMHETKLAISCGCLSSTTFETIDNHWRLVQGPLSHHSLGYMNE